MTSLTSEEFCRRFLRGEYPEISQSTIDQVQRTGGFLESCRNIETEIRKDNSPETKELAILMLTVMSAIMEEKPEGLLVISCIKEWISSL